VTNNNRSEISQSQIFGLTPVDGAHVTVISHKSL